ncbi:MAG: hypothetical protein JWO97_1771 [Acidobacteria bacterium]|nr:hypothetical protein [Acidobacteriota bacterium]
MLWTVQLEHFINQHPELDHEQRSVVYEALGLLAAGTMEGNATSEDFTAQTRELQQRAAPVFPPSWIAAVFVKLGEPETTMTLLRSGGVEQIPTTELPLRHISWLCGCNTDPQQDFCGGLTGPEHCNGSNGYCSG